MARGNGSGLAHLLGGGLLHLGLGDDIEKARKWVRYAWIAGLVAAGINALVAIMTVSGTDSQGAPMISGGQFAFVIAESLLIAGLAYGVRKMSTGAAVALLGYFLVSKVLLLSLGMLKPEIIPLQALFAFLFFQGLRGVVTFRHLTRPDYPAAPQQASGEEETRYTSHP